MSAEPLRARLEAAVAAAREAGDGTLAWFRRPDLAVETKPDRSPVTAADREAEALLRRRLEAAFPEDGIVGEELGTRDGTSGFVWTLDPIDGTKSFVQGVPLYGTLVGLLHDDQAVAGVIHCPAAGETVYAARGLGARWQAGGGPIRPARVSSGDDPAAAVFCTTSVEAFRRVGREDVFRTLSERARLTRTWGDCYGYLLVATGRAEIMVDPGLALWDAGPLLPILEEAGGTFTDWKGNATVHGGNGVATNGRLAGMVMAVTAAS